MNTTQDTMIQAAASIAALMPPKPAKKLMGDRTEQLVYSVYEAAAKAAYIRAAQEGLTRAFDEAGGTGFLQALRDVCKKHGVQITPSMYDGLQVWDLGPNDETLHFPEIENCTNKKETP